MKNLGSEISNYLSALILDETEDAKYHREKIDECLADAHGGPPITLELSPVLIKRMVDATERSIAKEKLNNNR